jgi:2-dehydropantoate 2-reductase
MIHDRHTPDRILRITVVGAGAIGGLIAALLAQAGHDVGVLARGKTLEAIREHGIRVVDSEGSTSTTRVRASEDATDFGMQDVVVIALKAQALPGIAASLEPLVGAQTAVVTAMNGLPWWFLDAPGMPLAGQRIEAVDPGGVVSRALPAEQALGCVVYVSASTDAPGVVRRGPGNQLMVGPAQATCQPLAKTFASALSAGGFDAEAVDDIRIEIWVKLLNNMNMNPISALTGSTVDRLIDDPLIHALVLRMVGEAEMIGERLGLSATTGAAERIEKARKLGAIKTSMLQDMEAGKSLEVEPILGVFPELGSKLGVPTPFCDAVLGLLRQRAANSSLTAG